MFIQTESTPNPNAVKFIPGVEISPNGPIHFANKNDAENTSLGRRLFSIDGIESVFFGRDFITITKNDDSLWDKIKVEVIVAIMDHVEANIPIFDHKIADQNLYIDLSEIEKQIVEIIETRVRPSVAMDGGDIIFKSFENGIVTLVLKGACSGCPSSTITLKQGIESMLKYYVPEVISVEACAEEN